MPSSTHLHPRDRLQQLLALPLLFAAAYAPAQAPTPPPSTPAAVENTNSAFSPVDVNIPQASPARPTVTTPAHIPPTGYLQFEQGFIRSDASPDGVSAQTSLNQVTKIALTTRLMIQFLSQPYTRNITDDGPTHTLSTDPGDLGLGVQYVVKKQAGPLPTIALGYIRRVRSGSSANIDTGDLSQSALLLLGGDLPLNLHYDANIFLNEQLSDQNSTADHTIRRAQAAQSLAISRPLLPGPTGSRLAATVELYHFTQPFVSSTTSGQPLTRANAVDLLFALGYAIRPYLIFDASFTHGLTSTSTRWQGGVGFTYLLPHRLWPDRRPIPKTPIPNP